jgi:exosortase
MNFELRSPVAEGGAFWLRQKQRLSVPLLVLLVGIVIFAVPTMFSIFTMSWSTEQGAHGPIVLATGIWLIVRSRQDLKELYRPGSPALTALMLVPCLLLYALARITGVVEIEGFAMYGALIAVTYCLLGAGVLKLLWFPIVYLAFIIPPPDTLVAAATQPVKILISEGAVELLYKLGYPVANSGVTIQIAQYELLVAAACAGLNSMISLTAIGLFYVYIRHNANWKYAALLMLAILPVAVAANFLRVIILILVTYYFGDAVAQGFVHNFAGITMFMIALLLIFAVDAIASPLQRRFEQQASTHPRT